MASIHPGEQAGSEPNKLRFHGPETTNATPSPPLNKNQSKTPTVLAIQYEAVNILALEYFPESHKKLKISTPAVKQTRGMDPGKQRIKNNYITQLYGWSAWWIMVERQNRPEKTTVPVSQKISELEKSEERFRKSEVERVKFLEKYYPRPEKSYEEEVKPTETVHTEGGCTP